MWNLKLSHSSSSSQQHSLLLSRFFGGGSNPHQCHKGGIGHLDPCKTENVHIQGTMRGVISVSGDDQTHAPLSTRRERGSHLVNFTVHRDGTRVATFFFLHRAKNPHTLHTASVRLPGRCVRACWTHFFFAFFRSPPASKRFFFVSGNEEASRQDYFLASSSFVRLARRLLGRLLL